MSFISTGPAADQTTTVSEAGYNGSFTTSTTTCANIVTISGPSASGTITVEPQNAGTCSFSVSDSNGQSKSVNVTVTLTSGTVK